MDSHNRLPSLDGLRAIAIFIVLVAHAAGTHGLESATHYTQFAPSGSVGVRLFFVLSGFLITTLLIREEERFGGVSLTHFFFRRTFRIFPACYTYILIMLLANVAGWVVLMSGDAIHALTYTTNYHRPVSWYLGHLWSLAVEEQFYLLWPLAFVMLRKHRANYFAAFCIVAVPGIRVLSWVLLPSTRDGIGESFQTVADALATGCLLAGTISWLEHRSSALRYFDHPVCLAILVSIVYTSDRMSGIISFSFAVGETLMNLSLAAVIYWFVRNSSSLFGRFLNWKPVASLGLMSYSLYLWQQPFLNRNNESMLCTFPLNVICAITAAYISFRFIETPFLRLRTWLDARFNVHQKSTSAVESTSVEPVS